MTQTHTDGFTLVKPVLTSKKVVALIEELEAAYAKEFKDGVYKFRPEPISEGGIEFTAFPGKCKSMVKALRFEFGYDLNLSWPLISDNTFEQWKKDKEDHELSNGVEDMSTFLMGFDGAPEWTEQEIKIWKAAFQKVGIVVA